MNRRKFIFASLLAPFTALAAKFSPKPIQHRYPRWHGDGATLGHDCAEMRCDLNETEYRQHLLDRFGVPDLVAKPPNSEGHTYRVIWVTKNGYETAPSPLLKL